MNNFFLCFFLMINMFMIFFIMSMSMYFLDYSIMLEWMLMSLNSMNMELYMLIDWISLLFISLVTLISSMIMFYSSTYMNNDKFIKRFIYLMLLFILSMIMMIISPNIISILFGWDGLGLVSYCLIIYYQNYSSYNSGMVTVLCNRIGDVGVLMSIGLMMMKGSWNTSMISGVMYNNLFVMMLLLAAITKSAQIPFSYWLPMAMAAPTPVSALVHSSTLVTAGVYLMIRFEKFMGGCMSLMFFLSVLTMLMSGMMANFEFDLKKIIALSTLSQLGMMMMVLSLGYKMFAYYHLLTHAMFKSMLFMCAGIIIHSLNNNQDIRMIGNLNEIMPFTMMSFMVSSFALCGFPFMAGFYSKDLIMEIIYSNKVNIMMLVFIIMSLVFTVSYSIRLFYFIYFSEMKFKSSISLKEDYLMNFSMLILILMSIMMGSMMNWLFFFDFYLIYLNMKIKLITLFMCMLGVIMGMGMKNLKIIKFYHISYYLSSMWFLNQVYVWIFNPFNIMSDIFYKIDKSWIEFFEKDLKMLIKNLNFTLNFKIYMFGYFFIMIIILVYLLM
uniref:NADH-ubiquinone oxidoreductase chain 5 n=1 Tax=Myrmica scabrinodis TaxID=207696 RepID=A0A0A8P2Y9_9HYME|nr:NADH dehydrogenase subunit 5 [Myrmica scabrinodis]CEF49547.1 NADH dehydrogenase subunit 5 [Myrmica scabrinodis]